MASSQRRRDDVRAEREDQLRTKRELAQQRRDEEDYFARMWSADMESKARKEEEQLRRQTEANYRTLAVLQQQMAEVEEKKRQEKQLLDEQAQIIVSNTNQAGRLA